VEQISFRDNTGVYSVTLPESYKFDPAKVKKAVGRFTLERIDLRITGDVAKDDKGVWLTARSGVKFLLSNRPKKDEKDSPPDILAKIAEGMKAGKTTFAVTGALRETKDAMILDLDVADVVEKEKKKEGK
jgi:hypothetical protein